MKSQTMSKVNLKYSQNTFRKTLADILTQTDICKKLQPEIIHFFGEKNEIEKCPEISGAKNISNTS